MVFLIGVWASQLAIDSWAVFLEDGVYLIQQHLMLVLYSGGLAIVIGIPLGIFLSRPKYRKMADNVMQALNIGSAIPTLAVIALSMSFMGIGAPPAILALTIATILPIARNTYAGITSVPAHMMEAANGIGMTKRQILFRVELPNALYVIFAGVRTALAINVGTVPLAFLIGGGGLGELIFTGIALNDNAILLAGAIPTALLAMVVDAILVQISKTLISRGVYPKESNQ
ncbi:MAG: ABC transporter permease [Ostreibacterium sp.]